MTTHPTTPRLTLVSHHLCPYVQRAVIALAEKGVPFARIDIDLAAKPDWFLRISPLGRVPVLIVEDAGGRRVPVFESAVIVEYLEETAPNPLHPADPLERADHRAWIEMASATLAAIAGFYAAPPESFAEKTAALAARIARMAARLPDPAEAGGPWFAGPRFSLVDAAWAPVMRYLDAFERIDDFGLLPADPTDAACFAAWRRALARRPSVAAAVATDYPERLSAFLARRGSALSHRLAA